MTREVSTPKEGITFWVEATDVSDWIEVRHCKDRKNGDVYAAHDISQESQPKVGKLRYIKGFPSPDCISIIHLGVHRSHQNRGVGSALLERLHADNPDYKIDPGVTTELGLAFTRYILDHEPEAPKALASHYVEKTVGY